MERRSREEEESGIFDMQQKCLDSEDIGGVTSESHHVPSTCDVKHFHVAVVQRVSRLWNA